ncbi:hypothetical protein PIB30_038094 [Stylosanthes scabra]|uniref:Uncharacterized protein n=1 Tax=Stylosanthes scabra TaxID=79078 RepID=A0ABU6ZAW4_9FABA|nr:hypothetical protein [Stylosanthes scabra]
MLFQIVLLECDPCLVVPSDKVGRVIMEYVGYLMCVKKHIRQYEDYSTAEIKFSTPILVKDLYFMTGNLSPTTIASLDARCYKSQPSSRRKSYDSVVTVEPAKRGTLPGSNEKVIKRYPKKPLKPSIDATLPCVSTSSRVLPSLVTKTKVLLLQGYPKKL